MLLASCSFNGISFNDQIRICHFQHSFGSIRQSGDIYASLNFYKTLCNIHLASTPCSNKVVKPRGAQCRRNIGKSQKCERLGVGSISVAELDIIQERRPWEFYIQIFLISEWRENFKFDMDYPYDCFMHPPPPPLSLTGGSFFKSPIGSIFCSIL